MKQSGWRWLALLLCLVLLAGCGETEPSAPESDFPASTVTAAPLSTPEATEAPDEPGIVLWLEEDLPFCDCLDALAAEYSTQHPEQQLRVFRFPNREELNLALRQGKPDLLLCSGSRAVTLATEGLLSTEAAGTAELLLRPCFQSAPEGFFPLGGELPVLAVKEENLSLLPKGGSLEELCAQAEDYARRSGRPFFSADSFSVLFSGALTQRGCSFYARRDMDLENKDFQEIYNLLAGCAFEGGLVSLDEPVLPAVERGELVCGICSSKDILDHEAEGISVLPLPPLAGCEALTESRLWGLAALNGAQAEAADFLAWLYAQGGTTEAALDAGLLPAAENGWAAEELFAAVLDACRICCAAEDSGYVRNGVTFEQGFRSALALLG